MHMIETARASGLTPAQLLRDMGNGLPTPGIPKPTPEQIFEARKAAAPYYDPRLAAVVAKVNQPGDPWAEILSLVEGKSRGLPSESKGKSGPRSP
jgi:hypothetical protein